MDRNSRQSVLGSGISPLVIPPAPGGTISDVDREHIAGLYAGIVPSIDDINWRIIRNLAVAVGSIADDDSYTSSDWDIIDDITSTIGAIADDDSYNSTDWDIIDNLATVVGAA